MERQWGLSELSAILWVSAVEGCPLSGVPLYIISVPYTVSDTLSVDFKKKADFEFKKLHGNIPYIHLAHTQLHMKSNHPTVQWETQFQGPKQLGTQGLASHSRAKRTQDLGVLKLYNCDRAATITVQGVPIHSSLALLQIHSIPGILCECINNEYYRHLFQRRSEAWQQAEPFIT